MKRLDRVLPFVLFGLLITFCVVFWGLSLISVVGVVALLVIAVTIYVVPAALRDERIDREIQRPDAVTKAEADDA